MDVGGYGSMKGRRVVAMIVLHLFGGFSKVFICGRMYRKSAQDVLTRIYRKDSGHRVLGFLETRHDV